MARIDPTKQYRYARKSDTDLFGHHVTNLTRFPIADLPWVGICNGKMKFFNDDDLSLIEVDPVTHYANAYHTGTTGQAYHTLAACLASRTSHHTAHLVCTGVLVTHASGKLRTLPPDTTTDPES